MAARVWNGSGSAARETPMRKNFRFSAFFLASSFLLLAGCHKGPQDGVVATVNGHPIMRAEVDKLYDAQLAQSPQANISSDQANAARLQALTDLIFTEIEQQQAAKLGLTATDSEVDAKLAEMKAAYTEEQFQAKLKASNTTTEELRHDLRRALTLNKLLNREINSKITITDADVSSYFNAHKAEYNLIDTRYHIAGIQVGTQPQTTDNLQNSKSSSDADARKKIAAIKNRIDAGEDFGALAMNYSENPATAPNGGDMGFIFDAQMKEEPAVYSEIVKLKAGETTPVLPIVDPQTHKVTGYAIYKLLGKDAPGQRDLNDPVVQQHIRQQLQESRSQLLKAAYFEVMRDQAKVQNFLAEQIFKDTAK
jgi:peptidyl-prolyl cis-trans isomerase SurA